MKIVIEKKENLREASWDKITFEMFESEYSKTKFKSIRHKDKVATTVILKTEIKRITASQKNILFVSGKNFLDIWGIKNIFVSPDKKYIDFESGGNIETHIEL